MGNIYGYGYQWWHGNFKSRWDNATVVTGTGYGGQNLFIVPEKKLVVTVFAGTYGKGDWTMPENILAEIIAAAP
jgi:CubicO group peptidase (beta-lactamase class C family)